MGRFDDTQGPGCCRRVAVAITLCGVAHAADESADEGLDIGGYGGLGVRYGRVLERNGAFGEAANNMS